MIRLRHALLVALVLTLGAAHAGAQVLPAASPDSLGLSAFRLARAKAAVQAYVDRGEIAGAVTLVMRDGKIAQLEAYGKADVEANAPMRPDTMFRIASMSKAVTSVAIMMLSEEGKLMLADPVAKHLPAFAKTTVAVAGPGGVMRAPAKRAITIRDLLTHTAGISYGTGVAAEQWKAAGLQGWYLSDRKEPIGALVDRMAALPFDAQPGEQWVYGYNTDILGAVVEKVSSMTLDAFFQTRIFEPLKMVDTHFFVPPEKRARLATVYAAQAGGGIARAPAGAAGQGDFVDGPRACFSGGAGLVATAQDYGRLLQMLLNGGELEGVRLLGPASVALMTTNHVGSLYQNGAMGFGLGFEVVEHLGRAGKPGSVGAYGWGSAYYSSYDVDPEKRLIFIVLTQLLPARTVDLRDTFTYLVYQAVTK
jgi:CubicO group peptidase (beta-lactamase class C family)